MYVLEKNILERIRGRDPIFDCPNHSAEFHSEEFFQREEWKIH